MPHGTDCTAADHPGLECLRWMGLQISCGLATEDAGLLRRYLLATDQLIRMGVLPAAPALEQALRLFYSSAHNTLLPWHWRQSCLDQLARPLACLGSLADTDAALAQRLQRFRWQLSHSPLEPAP